MGKSKNGGTRSFVRGRIGSDVYSIGKDGKGKKQQVIRSLAESVANPQTTAQMRGRMYMSTVMQAVAAMAMIIDHSFDGLAAGQPNISKFISENYKLVKADAIANPASGNKFGLVKYGEKGIKKGAYLISDGNAAALQGFAVAAGAKTFTVALASDLTVGGLKSALGITANDYFTLCAITGNGFVYERFHINPNLADATAIDNSNVEDLFTFDGNTSAAASLSGSNVVVTLGDLSENYGIIVSRKEDSGYKHSRCVLADPTSAAWTVDQALQTYPIGQQRFLNGGGDVNESVIVDNGGGSNTPAVAAPVISGTTPFTDSTQVSISGPAGASIYYTTNGATPTAESTLYSAPFTLTENTTVKAIAIVEGVSSSVTSKLFAVDTGEND